MAFAEMSPAMERKSKNPPKPLQFIIDFSIYSILFTYDQKLIRPSGSMVITINNYEH